MKIGDIVKYLSRQVLVVDMDDDWVYGVELGETQVGKYRKSYLETMNKEGQNESR